MAKITDEILQENVDKEYKELAYDSRKRTSTRELMLRQGSKVKEGVSKMFGRKNKSGKDPAAAQLLPPSTRKHMLMQRYATKPLPPPHACARTLLGVVSYSSTVAATFASHIFACLISCEEWFIWNCGGERGTVFTT